MPHLLTKASRLATPWKNGGGTTAEIAIAPAGAGFDDFDWRISLATITQSGGFSVFPGIDRSLMLVDGGGIELQIDDAPLFRLNAATPLVSFRGESAVHATVAQGTTTDFNVMTRRAYYSHQLEQMTLSGSHHLTRRSDITLLFLAGGAQLDCRSGNQLHRLATHDALLLTPDDPADWTLETAAPSTLHIVNLIANTTEQSHV